MKSANELEITSNTGRPFGLYHSQSAHRTSILAAFNEWLTAEIKAGNQTKEEAQTNLSDLKRMNEARLIKMAKLFGLDTDTS